MDRVLTKDESGLPLGVRILLGFGKKLRYGRLVIEAPDGRRYLFDGSEPGPSAELWVRRPRMAWRLLTNGDTGFAEAYIDGDYETPDLSAMLYLGFLNEPVWTRAFDGNPVFTFVHRLYHLMQPNTVTGSKRNIARHYDLGNSFYEGWLDPSMTYSSAVFEPESQSLTEAQSTKYRKLAQMAGLQPEQRVLEIGCGWGGFAAYAAGEIGCKVTAITISDAQYDYARQRIFEAGLAERVEIKCQDYRQTEGCFDRIASIEMFEAVGESYWPTFFRKMHENLKPGGRAALQVITMSDAFWDRYRRGADFIQRYIFPGGMLPSPKALEQQVKASGFSWESDKGYGLDYARTLSTWGKQFEAAWPNIKDLGFDERFKRMWRYYLAYSEAGFRVGRVDVKQISLAKA